MEIRYTQEELHEASERIKKARIQIQLEQPFFAYLSLYLKISPDNTGLVPTMRVDSRGNVKYSPKFVNELNTDKLKFVIIHEILHLVMKHLVRLGNRKMRGWNYATDLSINHIIEKNGYTAPSDILLADYRDEFEFRGYIITDVSKKTAEMIYDELEKEHEKQKAEGKEKGENSMGGTDFDDLFEDYEFDIHDYTETGGLTASEKEEIEKEWRDRLVEAITSSKMVGKIPKGIERLVDEIHKEKIDWRSALNKYITNLIPFDNCYSRPHKRSKGAGFYIPHLKKESIEIGVMVDLSGSVGQKEYTDFMSEIVGIARAYRERIKIHMFSHDTEGYYNGVVENGNIDKIMKMELKGGGGTCFDEPSKFVTEQNPNLKALIWLTDGYGTEITERPNYDILWVLEEKGNEDLCKYGRIIKL